ncbi:division/cell wall cluster transcriptional repressor MraZ [Shewanella gelidii]|uniref:Transcriptional regulator MraZ n=1 Tax=Shewanella gelidii TaxID=1642821 RepID=A0A917JSF8_9GAMM|nr:division/cell wall cluster transcriptional repressor MraZ [Shewanella gelidii]MCL1098385.1 division/cell wall cluster transcriptional repressor MraZ [Shewanella gelidii]GGI83128.1 transcriptional regulator MraZ [Shewanella gelidii]
MFRGASAINLDAKGRIAIPKRYRESLHAEHQGKLVITVDISSPCLLIYPQHQWTEIEAKLLRLSDTNPTQRKLKRLLLGHAHECELDSLGRILLPSSLRNFAQLEKHSMLVGQLNKFELWNESAWHQEIEDDLETIQSLNLSEVDGLEDFSL